MPNTTKFLKKSLRDKKEKSKKLITFELSTFNWKKHNYWTLKTEDCRFNLPVKRIAEKIELLL